MPTSEVHICKVEDDINKELLSDYKGEKTGWYQIGAGKYLLPSKIAQEANNFLNVKTRSDDVWISTFPRSGTTLTQEMVWMILNNCDYEKGSKLNLWMRSPFFEFSIFVHEEVKEKFLKLNEGKLENLEFIENLSRPGHQTITSMESPRIIKTHLPPSLLPSDLQQNNSKVIYVARNPKDIVISYYHLMKLWLTSEYVNSFDKFAEQFIKGLVPWGPYLNHIKEGWQKRNNSNYLFLFYEDMVKHLPETIKKVAEFLQHPMSDKDISGLAEHLNITNFKKNPSVNFESLRDMGVLGKNEQSFIRNDDNRDSKGEYTEIIKEKIANWFDDNLKELDIKFPPKI